MYMQSRVGAMLYAHGGRPVTLNAHGGRPGAPAGQPTARPPVFFSDYDSQVREIQKQSQGTLDEVEKAFLLRDWETVEESEHILFVNDGTVSGSLSAKGTKYPTETVRAAPSPRPADYIPGMWKLDFRNVEAPIISGGISGTGRGSSSGKTYVIAEEGRDYDSFPAGSKGFLPPDYHGVIPSDLHDHSDKIHPFGLRR